MSATPQSEAKGQAAAKPKVQPEAHAAGSSAARALAKLGLVSPWDFALHLPLRYEDATALCPLAQAQVNSTVQFIAVVEGVEVLQRGRHQLVLRVRDAQSTCTLRFFNFYPSQQKMLQVGARLRFRGELKRGRQGYEIVHPSFSPADEPLPQSYTPVYPAVAGLPQAYLRKAIANQLHQLERQLAAQETVPEDVLRLLPCASLSLIQSLRTLHQPDPAIAMTQLHTREHPAWQRLKAEELLAQQLCHLQARAARAQRSAHALVTPTRNHEAHAPLLVEQLLAALPFALTDAQRRVVGEIIGDLQLSKPMHRLLQGDVGSGKTVVSALVGAYCIQAGYQAALMVPTEILARQHYEKLQQWLAPLGVKVVWLAGAQGRKERQAALAALYDGSAQMVIGTHAVIGPQVQFARLALVMVDEQHRFGVEQRLALRQKAAPEARSAAEGRGEGQTDAPDAPAQGSPEQTAYEPHLLMMSATPIPRTLAMSYYADLDISNIDSLPPGRTAVVTKLIDHARKAEVIARLHERIALGQQVYWVCPLVEESETLDLANASATHEELRQALIGDARKPAARVGLLHARLPTIEKQAVMDLFVKGRMNVLVATTVIEVGVDVPNASLMVIEHAERFGLSQLHQLRGRVGRGAAAAACILLYSRGVLGEAARRRLQAMQRSNDGFEIARLDLEIRGPGEFLGARQSGQDLLRFAQLPQDDALLRWARRAAAVMVEHHPQQAQAHVQRWLGERQQFWSA